MRYSKSKHLNSFQNLVSNDWKPQLRFKCNCARPIYESQWYSMQSHSINNSHSHTKVCRPSPTLEVNLEQSVSKQSICSLLFQEQYHQIKAQANLIWILHSGRTKCFTHSLCSQISCSPMNVGQLQPLVQLVFHHMWWYILAGIPVSSH